ncbi:hypothetical protein EDD40_4354 [Saccharothrix texasensis]|uniref:Uncharacterized protein n=2 Tax=Saccharothrix texasensis TaxID=103734 RepID=A0A3N1H970_9PSEU|nr:hypothetical protein EDD40_4354 [Saccharothrix texasensis]
MVTAILFAVTIRLLWWSVEPLVPYIVVGLFIVTIIGFVWFRSTRW